MNQIYDVAIIGTGPAGVSAAITCAVRNKNVLLLGNASISDKVAKSHEIRNYPGLPEIPGAQLAQRYLDHLEKMNVSITDRKVTTVYAMGDYFSLQIDNDFVNAASVILATGVSFGKPLPGENENLGRGISYCATCDGILYKGKTVICVCYTAKEAGEVKFLSELADHVICIPAGGAKITEDMFDGISNIEIVKAVPVSVSKKEEGMTLTTSEGELHADGIFLLRESVAPDKLVPGLELDGTHVKTDRKMATNLPGLFAAGDLTGLPYQYIKSAGEGNVAALSAVGYIDRLKGDKK